MEAIMEAITEGGVEIEVRIYIMEML